MALLAVSVAALLVLSAAVAATPHTHDFFCFWTGARELIAGGDPYDAKRWSIAMSGSYVDIDGVVRSPFCPGRYGYPLSTAVLMAPLAALPLGVAAALWQALLLLGATAGVALLARAAALSSIDAIVLAILVFAGEPLWNTALNAQFGGVMLGLVAALCVLPREAAGRRGLAAAGLLLKPHVAPFVVVAEIARGPVAMVTAFAIAIGATLAVATVILPSWPGSWVSEVLGARVTAGGSTTLWGLADRLWGTPLVAAPAVVATVAILVPVLRRGAHLERVAALTVAGLAVAPYLGSHDQAVLAVTWAAVLARAARLRGDRADRLVVALVGVALLGPWMLYALARPIGSEVLSALVIPLAAVLLWSATRGRAEAGS